MENQVLQTAQRIKELRSIIGLSVEKMAEITGVTPEEYVAAEEGKSDFSFTFLHKCAIGFGVDISDIITGEAARLTRFSIVRKGEGTRLVRRQGFVYNHVASNFKSKMSEPFVVTAPYDEEADNKPIALSTHKGEELDYILKGSLKIQIGDHVDVLHEGDTFYYNSSMPHGMVATNGEDCEFLAIVMDPTSSGTLAIDDEDEKAAAVPVTLTKAIDDSSKNVQDKKWVYEDFVDLTENDEGHLQAINFKNEDKFNFAFDIVDKLGTTQPDRLAMLWVGVDKTEKRFTFEQIMKESARTANYFKSLGIKKGDRVMLVLKRHYQFWFSILALHKLGAVVIPATNQLVKKDFTYRFEAGEVKAIVCTADGDVAHQVDLALEEYDKLDVKVIVNGEREGWHNFNDEYALHSDVFERPTGEEATAGEDTLLMFFTSGTTGYPKIATHSHRYPLGHFITAKYWHKVNPDGIHLTISDTGWGKALWGKLYGQWMCEAAIFVYDFDRFDAHDILPMFAKHNITTFCAPPTMYRFFIKEDLSQYDLSSLEYATVAGEALNPEVYQKFLEATGLKTMEGFGQTETTLIIGNLFGMEPKPGSMGKPSPMYDVDIVDEDGKSVKVGEVGEIVVRTDNAIPAGLFKGYYNNTEETDNVWHDGLYHTGDTAWRDEDGYFWYVGRTDDVIKSSGYRIGPFEIESVIMELPYVLECAVTAAPDPIRGQVVKASIVLVKGKEGSDELVKEIQNYVKTHTAPYKYPRIVEFLDEMPKTISGKIQRVVLRDRSKQENK